MRTHKWGFRTQAACSEMKKLTSEETILEDRGRWFMWKNPNFVATQTGPLPHAAMQQVNRLVSPFLHFSINYRENIQIRNKEKSPYFLFDWSSDLTSLPTTIFAGGFQPTSSWLTCGWLLHSVPGSDTRTHSIYNVHYTRLNIEKTV